MLVFVHILHIECIKLVKIGNKIFPYHYIIINTINNDKYDNITDK